MHTMSAPTKSEEIAYLDHMIETLGEHSYLGPALAGRREWIVSQIHNDMPVDLAHDHEQLLEATQRMRREYGDLVKRTQEALAKLEQISASMLVKQRALADAQAAGSQVRHTLEQALQNMLYKGM